VATSASGVRIEDISRLVGHSGTAATEEVYRHELHAVLDDGPIVMDELFPLADAGWTVREKINASSAGPPRAWAPRAPMRSVPAARTRNGRLPLLQGTARSGRRDDRI
jgi:hypothetical protein